MKISQLIDMLRDAKLHNGDITVKCGDLRIGGIAAMKGNPNKPDKEPYVSIIVRRHDDISPL